MDEINTIGILRDLIAFQSVSCRPNGDIADYICDYLSGHGASLTTIPDRTGLKRSILARLGPADRPGVVLSAHTDVVPAEGQDWSSPPFSATLHNGRVVGRGATDMKGFVAVALAAAPRFAQGATATPVYFALSYDEEIGCRGAPELAAATASLPARPALCIVGEPTGLRVVRAHKGKVALRASVSGRGGHSAMPHLGANAAVAAARLTVRLAELAAELEAARADPAFDPPWSTLHIGSVHGGGALNLIPDRAAVEFELRVIPGEDVPAVLDRVRAHAAEISATLRRTVPEADVAVEEIFSYPALDIAAGHPAVAAVARLAEDRGPPGTVSFGTEAGVYAAAGIPSVVCGPGDIRRAHKADEWIGLDEIEAASGMMRRLADRLGRPIEEWLTG